MGVNHSPGAKEHRSNGVALSTEEGHLTEHTLRGTSGGGIHCRSCGIHRNTPGAFRNIPCVRAELRSQECGEISEELLTFSKAGEL